MSIVRPGSGASVARSRPSSSSSSGTIVVTKRRPSSKVQNPAHVQLHRQAVGGKEDGKAMENRSPEQVEPPSTKTSDLTAVLRGRGAASNNAPERPNVVVEVHCPRTPFTFPPPSPSLATSPSLSLLALPLPSLFPRPLLLSSHTFSLFLSFSPLSLSSLPAGDLCIYICAHS